MSEQPKRSSRIPRTSRVLPTRRGLGGTLWKSRSSPTSRPSSSSESTRWSGATSPPSTEGAAVLPDPPSDLGGIDGLDPDAPRLAQEQASRCEPARVAGVHSRRSAEAGLRRLRRRVGGGPRREAADLGSRRGHATAARARPDGGLRAPGSRELRTLAAHALADRPRDVPRAVAPRRTAGLAKPPTQAEAASSARCRRSPARARAGSRAGSGSPSARAAAIAISLGSKKRASPTSTPSARSEPPRTTHSNMRGDVLDLVAVRIAHAHRVAAEDAAQRDRLDPEPRLFPDLAHDCVARRFAGLDRTAGLGPAAAVVLVDQKDAAAVVVDQARHSGNQQQVVTYALADPAEMFGHRHDG